MNPSPPYTSGAGGPDFERRVATAIVCAAITGVNIAGFGPPPSTVWLQAGHLKCKLEDIVFETVSLESKAVRTFISVKSTINPRSSDSEFQEVVSRAWEDWSNETAFSRKTDRFLLAASTSKSPRLIYFIKLTELARASGSVEDFENRLSFQGYHAKEVRDLLPEVEAVIKKDTLAEPSTPILWSFLSKFYVATFDFDQDLSQDKLRTLGMLRLACPQKDESAAESCWNSIFEEISQAAGRAKEFGPEKFAEIAGKHGFESSLPARSRQWLQGLRAHCAMTRRGITSSLGKNNYHLIRQFPAAAMDAALLESQFILVKGPAGSGKSALAIASAEKIALKENIFPFQSEEFAYPHLDTALHAAGLTDVSPNEWQDALPFQPRVLVIESVERLLQSSASREALNQLLHLVSDDRRFKVIATCRDYLADHVLDQWGAFGNWNTVVVPLLENEELEEVIKNLNIPRAWIDQNPVHAALKNLKWLDLTLKALSNVGPEPVAYTWTTQAEWRSFVWRNLIRPETNQDGQELLERISFDRVKNTDSWVLLNHSSLETATKLVADGILSRQDATSRRYRPVHDLLEDWALLYYSKRVFEENCNDPESFFKSLGNHLVIRRAFRQFLGEHLESEHQKDGVGFILQVFEDSNSPKQWRIELITSLLGASCAPDILKQTENLWTTPDGRGLSELHHVLRIAYRGRSQTDVNLELPFGPGWGALMEFIYRQGEQFVRDHIPRVTAILIDWHYAVTPDEDSPPGLAYAARLVEYLWRIATEGDERFETYWSEDSHYSASANRLCWLVSAVAGALDPVFFHRVAKTALADRRKIGYDSADRELNRQCRELFRYITISYEGWTLARSHPKTMVRLCLQAYGLKDEQRNGRNNGWSQSSYCGLAAQDHDFEPPSAFRGPFLELLRNSPSLGEQFLLHLINVATFRWSESVESHSMFEPHGEIEIKVMGETLQQTASEGWWRCFRGYSPLHSSLECALMALEKWLLEDVGTKEDQDLESTLLRLISASANVAVTAVVCSVAGVYWWRCGEVAATLLRSWYLMDLDRRRWINDRSVTKLRSFSDGNSIHAIERQHSNSLSQRGDHLEGFIFRAQFGTGKESIQKVIDEYLNDLKGIEDGDESDEIKIVRLILHRIDLRNATANEAEGRPGYVCIQPVPPPPDLQAHLEIADKELTRKQEPMEMYLWAEQILEPLASGTSKPEKWREMLQAARLLDHNTVDPETITAFIDAPALVAAACIEEFWGELPKDDQSWCAGIVIELLFRSRDIFPGEPAMMLKSWREESAAAFACSVLIASELDGGEFTLKVRKALAIALTHPEKRVRLAAAKGIGTHTGRSDLPECACILLIKHARLLRAVDLRHRGPRKAPYPNCVTWSDHIEVMRSEVTMETRLLRDQFTNGIFATGLSLSLYYPLGAEEEENIPVMLTCLLNTAPKIRTPFFGRIRGWLAIQFTDESSRRHRDRIYSADLWRNDHGPARLNHVNVGEVSRIIARFALGLSENDACLFYRPSLKPSRLACMGDKSGEFLKDLCVTMDLGGSAEVFWAIWDEHLRSCIEIGGKLHDGEHWKLQRVKPSAVFHSFCGLVSTLFLNRMHFSADQKWPPIDGRLDRFQIVFNGFHGYALNSYVEFINSVGGGLLPAAWPDISKVVSGLVVKIGKHLLTQNSQSRLLRQIGKEVSVRRISGSDQITWGAIRDLLDILIDEGFSEAFRLREIIARTGSI